MPSPIDPPPRHVLDAVEWLMRRVAADVQRLQEHYPDVPVTRGSQGRILHLLPPEGARPTDLASGGWITKQAVGQRVRELEELGLVRTDPDPSDGRAVIVRRTPAGDHVADQLRASIVDMERWWAEQVGAERYATFRAVLDELGADHAPGLLRNDDVTGSGDA